VKTVDEIVSEVEAVTTADVRRVARELLQTDRLAVSIVGPHRSDKRFAPLLKI